MYIVLRPISWINLKVQVLETCRKVTRYTFIQANQHVFKKQKLSKSNEIDLLQANQHVYKKQKNVKNYKTMTSRLIQLIWWSTIYIQHN